MKKFALKAFPVLFFLAMFIGVALAAPNRQNTFPEKEPTEADYAVFLAEKEKQLALAQTPQEQKLALAVMPDAPRMTIRGTVLMPDGSPLPKDAAFFHYGLRSSNFTFSQSVSSDGTKRIDKNETAYHSHGTSGSVNKEGTLQIDNAAPTGANVLVDVYCAQSSNNTYKELLAKPAVFVAHPGMNPLEIRLEKGIPLRGKITYGNGAPAMNRGLFIEQKFEPPLGADIPEMQRHCHTSRWTSTDAKGNYEVFLLPGEYTVRDDHKEQMLMIAESDKEKKLDWTMPTPVFVEIRNQEDGLVGVIQYVTIDDENIRTSSSGARNGRFIIEPATHNRRLYVIDEEYKQGTFETITPDMIGKTMTFQLKPVSNVVITLTDSDSNPLVDKRVELSIHTEGQQARSSVTINAVQTDSTGKAVFRVAPGQFAVTIKLPGSFEEPVEQGGKRILNEIDKELDLAPGETLEVGTVRLSVK